MKNSLTTFVLIALLVVSFSCTKKYDNQPQPQQETKSEVMNVGFNIYSFGENVEYRGYDRSGAPLGIASITIQNFWMGDGMSGDIDLYKNFELVEDGESGDPIVLEGVKYGENKFVSYANQYPDHDGDGVYTQQEIPTGFMNGSIFYTNPNIQYPGSNDALSPMEGVWYKHWLGRMVNENNEPLYSMMLTEENVVDHTYTGNVKMEMEPTNSLVEFLVDNTSDYNTFTATVYVYTAQGLASEHEAVSAPNSGLNRLVLNSNLQRNMKIKVKFNITDGMSLNKTVWSNGGEYITISGNKRYFIGSSTEEKIFDISDENPDFLVKVPFTFVWMDLFENENITEVPWN